MAHVSTSKLMAAMLTAAGFAVAAGAQTESKTAAVSPILATPAVPETGAQPQAAKRPRAISGDVAAQLSAMMPKYTPPVPKPEPTPEELQPDMREIDKPKNTIVRLPKFIVQEPRPPVFTEREISTKKGLAEIAMRRYISETDRALNRFTLPLFGRSAESRALAMYAEDERLKNMSELSDRARMVSAADKAAGAYVKRQAEQTYMRTSDFGWSSGASR